MMPPQPILSCLAVVSVVAILLSLAHSEDIDLEKKFIRIQQLNPKRFLRLQESDKSECQSDMDCGPSQCCIPTVGMNHVRECRPLRSRAEMCHPQSRQTPFLGLRGFPLCPCEYGMECSTSSWRCEPMK